MVSKSFRCRSKAKVNSIKRKEEALGFRYGDLDLGIVGYDMFCELADGDPDLILIHEALNFGKCRLSLGVPLTGIYSSISTLDVRILFLLLIFCFYQDLRAMPQWSETRPMRVATSYFNVARKFFADHQFENVVLLGGDGALEAAPAMGSGDIILDLVSTGVTLRENNLRELEGGTVPTFFSSFNKFLKVLESQGVLVGNRQALLKRRGLLRIVREFLDRLDAHLKAEGYFSVVANMRGTSPQEIATKLIHSKGLAGLEGPTISPVYSRKEAQPDVYAACICVSKKNLYTAVKEIRAVLFPFLSSFGS